MSADDAGDATDLTGEPPAPALRVRPRTLGLVAGFTIFLAFVTLGATSQLLNVGFGLWFAEVFIFLGLASVVVRASGRDPVRYPGVPWIGPGPVAVGGLLAIANFFAAVVPLQFLMHALVPPSLRDAFDGTAVFRNATPAELVAITLGVTVAAAVCEEYFFRGVLQNALHEAGLPPARAILYASVIFSAFHLDPIGFPARLELGVLFGYLFWRTGSIWPGVLAHGMNNGISAGLYLALEHGKVSVKQPQEEPEVLQVVFAVLFGLVVLAGIVHLVRSDPSLLARRHRDDGRALPFRSPWRLGWPWIVAGLVSLAALVAVDGRGVRLNFEDLRYPLQKDGKDDPRREALREMRRRARSGEVPIETYLEQRRVLYEEGRAAEERAP